MTTPVKLELVWAEAGGTSDPSDSKYQLGWVSEIPTYQNFNHVLNALDKAKLSYAEGGIYSWQDNIAYRAGVKVLAGNKIFTCITSHNNLAGDNPQDPLLDNTNSYWVNGSVFSSKESAHSNLDKREGVKIDEVFSRGSRDLWQGNDLTITGKNSIIALNDIAGTKNLLFGNVKGKLVVVDVGALTNPDTTTNLNPSVNPNSFEVYHEGNKPTQQDVSGTIPASPLDGARYLRQGNSWVKDITSIESRDYGQITGIIDNTNDFGGLL